MHNLESANPSRTRAHEAFTRAFNAEPTVVTQASGRVNLIGEHTDYNEGYVLPTCIPLFCTVPASRAVGSHRVVAADLREEASFDLIAVSEGDSRACGINPGTWQSYAFGVMHEITQWLERHGAPALPALNLAIASDVPMGSGLASSAAFEVAIARALCSPEVLGESIAPPSAIEVAKLCQKAESEFAGVPCGIMDQLIVSTGNPGVSATMVDCRTLALRSVPLPDPRQARILIIDTRTRHSNAAGEYAARRASCETASKELGVPALRDADAYMLEHARAALTQEQFDCALHVVSENPRVLLAAEALRAGDMARLGELLNLSHRSLRDLYRVSTPELDAVVDAARRIEGVFGARMTGAGLGGCVLVLVEPGACESATAAIQAEFVACFARSCNSMVI